MKKISIEQTITIAANIGVIAGIIFLGFELRQTQEAMKSQAFQARALDAISWSLDMAKDENLGRIHILIESGKLEPSSLTQSERQIAFFLLDGARLDVDNEHYQYENGFLDSGFYYGVTVPMIKHYAPIWRDFGIREGRPEFRREVDRVLTDTPPSSSITDELNE